MPTLNIALLQMVSCGTDRGANLAKGEEFCRRAAAMGADIALFPEMWSVGYGWEPVPPKSLTEVPGSEKWQARAVSRDDAFIDHFRSLARELDMAIALTYLEKWPGLPRNSMSLIDRHGEIAMTYAKVHTCDFSEECNFTPGDDFYVCDLDTRLGPVKIGAMICYDREFPESARILMLMGAEIVLTPNACEMEPNRLMQFRTRATENMLGVALANYAAPQDNGHSVAYDGIAFAGGTEQVDGVSRDTLIIEAGEAEGIYMAPFDLDALRAYRRVEGWGNAYRKPRVYGPLVSAEVSEPFIRHDARR
jgi:N-carbamoylputrescine amidase